MLILLIPAVAFVVIFAKEILSIFGLAYVNNATFLPQLLVLSVIPWGIIYLDISIERINKESLQILLITGMSMMLSLGLCYFFLLMFGLNGLGFAYLLAQIIIAGYAIFKIWNHIFSHNGNEIKVGQ